MHCSDAARGPASTARDDRTLRPAQKDTRAAPDPEYLTFGYRCPYRGIPGVDHNPEDYPITWTVSIGGTVWDGDDDDSDAREVHVGDAHFSIAPDAGLIDLFDTLNAVDQELAKIAEMLTIERPDLTPDVGGTALLPA